MAKYLLWFMFVLTFFYCFVQYINNHPVEPFTKILLWSFLGVLGICESIEKASKH